MAGEGSCQNFMLRFAFITSKHFFFQSFSAKDKFIWLVLFLQEGVHPDLVVMYKLQPKLCDAAISEQPILVCWWWGWKIQISLLFFRRKAGPSEDIIYTQNALQQTRWGLKWAATVRILAHSRAVWSLFFMFFSFPAALEIISGWKINRAGFEKWCNITHTNVSSSTVLLLKLLTGARHNHKFFLPASQHLAPAATGFFQNGGHSPVPCWWHSSWAAVGEACHIHESGYCNMSVCAPLPAQRTDCSAKDWTLSNSSERHARAHCDHTPPTQHRGRMQPPPSHT